MNVVGVLSGGGGRLAWQAGVMHVLEQENISFDALWGTSGGALVSWFVATGRTDRLVELVTEEVREFGDIYRGSRRRFVWRLALHLVGFRDSPMGVYDMGPLRKRMQAEWDDWDGTYETDFYPVKVSANTGTVIFDRRRLDDILASTAIPGFVEPVEMPSPRQPKKTEMFVDGRLREHTPLGLAVAHSQADRVLVLSTEAITPRWEWTSIGDFFDLIGALFGIASTEVRLNDVRTTERINSLVRQATAEGVTLTTEAGRELRPIDLIIAEPSEKLADGLEIDHETLNTSFDIGVRDGRELLENHDLVSPTPPDPAA